MYDNTRIIIAADHGADIATAAFATAPGLYNRNHLNPLFLVKDFNASFPLQTSAAFMTNADVPSLAFEGVIANPVNPFTGKPVNSAAKDDGCLVTVSGKVNPEDHNSTTFNIRADEWYLVRDDMFNADNWVKAQP